MDVRMSAPLSDARLLPPEGTGIGTLVFHTLATCADYHLAGGKYGRSAGPEDAR